MRALVLSGGGSRGSYQVGVLKRWMGEQNVEYDLLCGVSVGALNVAGLAHTPKGNPKEAIDWLENFWLTEVAGTNSIYKRWFPFGRLHALWKRSVYNSSPLAKLVRERFDYEKVQNNGRKLAVGAVCLDSGEHAFGTDEDGDFVEWVLASSSYPVFFEPIFLRGKLWSDGGIVNITPLGQAVKMGATDIDVVICSDPWSDSGEWSAKRKVAVPDQVVRTLNLMSDQILRDDVRVTGLKNELADWSEKYRKVRVRVAVPHIDLAVDSLKFDPQDIRRLIEIGKESADRATIYE